MEVRDKYARQEFIICSLKLVLCEVFPVHVETVKAQGNMR